MPRLMPGGFVCLCLLAISFPAAGAANTSSASREGINSRQLAAYAGWQTVALPGGTANLLDMAFSPQFEQDGTFFVLGWDGVFKLWRSRYGVWTQVTPGGSPDSLDRVLVVGGNLLLAGSQAGTPTMWHSADGGATFSARALPVALDQWACAAGGTLFVAGYDGSRALIYGSADFGQSFSAAASAGHQPVYSIAVSPAYAQDRMLVVGNTNGEVWWSQNGGTSFQEVDSSLSANVSLALDPLFASNRRIFAASDAPDGGVYSLTLGTGQSWQRLDSGLAPGAMMGSVAVSASGVLYASNYQATGSSALRGGMVRCLDGSCEVVLAGLSEGATLWRLWLAGSCLWAIDSTHNQLVSYTDYLSQPVRLIAPASGALRIGSPAGGKIGGISLEWEALLTATSYQWQLDTNGAFVELPGGFQGNTAGTSARPPALNPLAVYCWRVRAIAPLTSPWSAVWYFLTAENALPAPSLEMPLDGAVQVGLKPLFDWSPVSAATGYELAVSTQPDFSSLVLSRTLSGHSWQTTISLSYGTTYYWRVRTTAPAPSSWSRVWSFITLFDALDVPLPESPAAGATQVPCRPLFVWSAVNSATGYELALSTRPDFSVLLLLKTVSGHSWQVDVNLDWGATYYWRVRAFKSSVQSAWSAASCFATVSQPASSTTPTTTPTALTLVPVTLTLVPLPPALTPPVPALPPTTTAVVQPTTTVTETSTPPPTIVAITQNADWLYLPAVLGAVTVLMLLAVLLLFTGRRRPPAL